jgi:hypothetical protein
VGAEEGLVTQIARKVAYDLGPKCGVTKEGTCVELSDLFAENHVDLQEAKANVASLLVMDAAIREGILSPASEDRLYVGFAAELLDKARGAPDDDYTSGAIIGVNAMVQSGGFLFNSETGRFALNKQKMLETARALTEKYVTLQNNAQVEEAKAFLRTAVPGPELAAAIQKIRDLRLPDQLHATYPVREEVGAPPAPRSAG